MGVVLGFCLVKVAYFPSIVDRVGESVESARSALAAIFSALSAYFNIFRQKIPYFDMLRQNCNKTMFRYAKNVRLASFL